MNLLTCEHITKAYSERVLLDDVGFSVHQGEKIGVIGTNGMGKSTLLKIISGIEEADQGEIVCGNHVQTRYLSQTPVFQKDATVLDAVLFNNVNELNQWSVESEAKSILNQLAITDYEMKVEHLSGGQRKRLALANVLLAPVEILILDEPTNHLDNEMSQWLEDYLLNFTGAVVLVTHDRYFLDRVVTKIVEVDKGSLYSYSGNYSEFVRLKAERQNMELATEKKRQSILRTELEWLQRGARARATKQKAHIQRIEAMQQVQAPQESETVQMSSIASRMGKKTIEVERVSKSYDGETLFRDFTYIFLKNDRIGIVGPNGCGKSTLLKVITQNLDPQEGSVTIGETIQIGYFTQENEDMDQSIKAIEYIRDVAEYIQTSEGTITASQMMERFLFDGTMQWTQISRLSGGEKRRLYLLRILMSQPNVLILDEPTNDLDIQTLTILEDYLDAFDGIVITVSHDRYFLDRIARRIFAFEGEGIICQYEGGYSDYLLARPEEENHEPPKETVPKQKIEKPRERKLKFSYKEQREFNSIEEDIEKLEEAIAGLAQQIVDHARDYGKLRSLTEEKDELTRQLEDKMERWEYLNELYERICSEES